MVTALVLEPVRLNDTVPAAAVEKAATVRPSALTPVTLLWLLMASSAPFALRPVKVMTVPALGVEVLLMVSVPETLLAAAVVAAAAVGWPKPVLAVTDCSSWVLLPIWLAR